MKLRRYESLRDEDRRSFLRYVKNVAIVGSGAFVLSQLPVGYGQDQIATIDIPIEQYPVTLDGKWEPPDIYKGNEEIEFERALYTT